LFSVKFQASILDESHNFLVKLSCKSVRESLDVSSAKPAVWL